MASSNMNIALVLCILFLSGTGISIRTGTAEDSLDAICHKVTLFDECTRFLHDLPESETKDANLKRITILLTGIVSETGNAYVKNITGDVSSSHADDSKKLPESSKHCRVEIASLFIDASEQLDLVKEALNNDVFREAKSLLSLIKATLQTCVDAESCEKAQDQDSKVGMINEMARKFQSLCTIPAELTEILITSGPDAQV